jgi:hypothetical protein
MKNRATLLTMQVHAEQTRMIYAYAPLSLIALLLNTAILVYLLWSVVDNILLIVWALLTILIGPVEKTSKQ